MCIYFVDPRPLSESNCNQNEYLRYWRSSFAVSEPRLWHQIKVPSSIAARMGDRQLAVLLPRSGGQLSALHLSGSGITSRSLRTLIEVKILFPLKIISNCGAGYKD